MANAEVSNAFRAGKPELVGRIEPRSVGVQHQQFIVPATKIDEGSIVAESVDQHARRGHHASYLGHDTTLSDRADRQFLVHRLSRCLIREITFVVWMVELQQLSPTQAMMSLRRLKLEWPQCAPAVSVPCSTSDLPCEPADAADDADLLGGALVGRIVRVVRDHTHRGGIAVRDVL